MKLIFALFFSKICRGNSSFIKIQQEWRVLYMQTFSHLWQYFAKLLLVRNFLEKVVEKIKTHILCSITFFRKLCCLWDNVEKCGGAREATNDDTIWRLRVACWISKGTCTHTPTRLGTRTHTQICNIYCFSTAAMIRERASLLRYRYTLCVLTSALVRGEWLKSRPEWFAPRKEPTYALNRRLDGT
jgi:hypothetical protein